MTYQLLTLYQEISLYRCRYVVNTGCLKSNIIKITVFCADKRHKYKLMDESYAIDYKNNGCFLYRLGTLISKK